MNATTKLISILAVSAALGACAQQPATVADGGRKLVGAECAESGREGRQYRNPFLRARHVGAQSCNAGE